MVAAGPIITVGGGGFMIYFMTFFPPKYGEDDFATTLTDGRLKQQSNEKMDLFLLSVFSILFQRILPWYISHCQITIRRK